MRKWVLGALVGASLAALAAGVWQVANPALAQRPAVSHETAGEGGLIALSATTADGGQLVTLIDPKRQALGVYRIDPLNGHIKLLSVRNVQWDLQMVQLNSEKPLPDEIQSLLERR